MKLWIVVFLTAACLVTLAAEAPKVAPLTKDEVIRGRTLQLDFARADGQFNAACDDRCKQALAYRQQALARLQQWQDEVYSSRKITQADAALCDGPAQGVAACEKTKAGELELVTITKPPETGKKP